MSGKLYLVATPIGNLEDITLRAINILNEVDLIAAEDTRHTLKLLNHLKIKKTLVSYYKQNEKNKSEFLISELLAGKNIALVSDAGTPAISDPGYEIVKSAIKNDIEICPIPGACALVNALICSGMETKEFSFIGFLSTNKKEKKEKLEELKNDKKTLIFYEAPHKLKNNLEIIKEILGDRNIVLARELTKIHEEIVRGKISEILDKIGEPRGEFVLVIEGSKKIDDSKTEFTLEEHYKYYEEQGLEKKEIIKKIAKDRNVQKNEIYKYFMQK